MFKNWARRFLPTEARPTTEWEWLALAQHHGLPTRLLDWSLSPLVAAFFAVEDDCFNEDSLVYAYQTDKILDNRILPNVHPFAVNQVLPFFPPHMSPRIAAQSGVFTLHYKPNVEWRPKGLQRVVIRKKFRSDLKHRLYNVGIHKGSLFPDLDGVANVLGWVYSTNADNWNYPVDRNWHPQQPSKRKRKKHS